MENEYTQLQHEKLNVSSQPSIMPPPYTDPSQYPSTSGIPYPQQYPSPNGVLYPQQYPPPAGMPYPQQYQPPNGMPYPQQYPPPNPAMGYPPNGVPPAPGAQPYYPPPGVVYPGQPGPIYPGQQGQQQVVIMNTQPMGVGGVFYGVASRSSMIGAIVLSCIVFWFCGFIFGGIAFILAMVGQSSAAAGDNIGAIRMRNASYSLSIVGIIIAIVLIAAIAGALNSTRSYYYYCSTYYSYRSSYYCK